MTNKNTKSNREAPMTNKALASARVFSRKCSLRGFPRCWVVSGSMMRLSSQSEKGCGKATSTKPKSTRRRSPASRLNMTASSPACAPCTWTSWTAGSTPTFSTSSGDWRKEQDRCLREIVRHQEEQLNTRWSIHQEKIDNPSWQPPVVDHSIDDLPGGVQRLNFHDVDDIRDWTTRALHVENGNIISSETHNDDSSSVSAWIWCGGYCSGAGGPGDGGRCVGSGGRLEHQRRLDVDNRAGCRTTSPMSV